MNCDQAFDDLTNPLLLDRTELEQHLRDCARCRQMQETLAPALSWMSDSPGGWSAGGLKSSDSGPLLTLQALQVAERCALELDSRRPLPTSTWLRRGLMLTAVAFCGFALGVWGMERREPPTAVSLPPDAGLLTACLWTQPGRQAADPDQSARHIVVSCIMCHVPGSQEEVRVLDHWPKELPFGTNMPVCAVKTSIPVCATIKASCDRRSSRQPLSAEVPFVGLAGVCLDRNAVVSISGDGFAGRRDVWGQSVWIPLGAAKIRA